MLGRVTATAALVWALALTAGVECAELPAGAEIHIRLQGKVGSSFSKQGDPVKAVVISPVLAGGQIIIPAGAVLNGKVVEAQPGKEQEQRALLGLEFGELEAAKDTRIKLPARVVAVDNGREIVDEAGKILGITASETLSAQMDKGLEKLGKRAAGLADFLQAAKSAVIRQAETEIDYGPGVELTLQLARSAEVTGALASATSAAPEPIPGEAELFTLVNAQPFQTMAEKPSKPSDITNLMLIGSRERVEKAFAAAGWATATKLNATSGLETFRAIAENRGYQEAPVSTLLLDGNKPDLVFQKQLNTFAKRHHLRIWRRPDTFQGRPVWVSAATHDIGIEFSPESRTFIHKIDPQIDRERAKVVNDLLLSGMVAGLALVDRPSVPRKGQNATGDALETDGSMAVLLFQP